MKSAMAAVLVAGSAVSAQVITITGQERYINAVTTIVDSGVPTTNGPRRDDAPTGDFGTWSDTLPLDAIAANGSNHVDGHQEGGFDGVDTIQLFAFSMNYSGGGGPGTSGTGTLTNHFGYTFTVNQAATYTLDGFFGSGLPVLVSFSLTGPGVSIARDDSDGNVIEFVGVTGTMQPGSYTLKLEGTGTIAWTGPGGNGSGAGGQQPLMTLKVTAGAACYANCDGSTAAPILNANDFSCFLNAFANGNSYANCDESTVLPVLNANDFSCFLNAFAGGCQ